MSSSEPDGPTVTSFDDGLSAVVSSVMRSGGVDLPTARTIVHALRESGYLT